MSSCAREICAALQTVTVAMRAGDAVEAAGGGPLDRRDNQAMSGYALEGRGEIPPVAYLIDPLVGGIMLPAQQVEVDDYCANGATNRRPLEGSID